MTDYSVNLAAKEQIPFVELYQFRRGSERGYYTNYSQNVVFATQTYFAATITRNGFSVDGNLSNVSTTITGAVLSDFGVYIASQPSERTEVNIYRAVSDDLDEYAMILSGNVTGVTFSEDNRCTLQVTEKASILDREVDMIVHSVTCNHNVFYGDCSLDPLLWRVVSSNTTFSGSTLYVNECSVYADNYFQGGEVHIGNDARLITGSSGTALSLHVGFPQNIVDGTEVEIYPGCDRKPSTCLDKFNNLDNYLGMPYIPDKNPTMWGL